MSKNLSVNVEFLTRVEGHGHIVVDMKNGVLNKCELQIVEAPRFFEAMVRGRSIFELQHITCRICGICSCGHSLASIQAAEDAIGFTPSEQTLQLRKLLLHLENLDSHILHIYMLAAPDMLGKKSALALTATHGDAVRRALRMKKCCNDACAVLVGRHVHPISSTVGGFTKIPSEADLLEMRKQFSAMKQDLLPTLELAKTFVFPEFHRETEYVALKNDSEYALLSGKVSSSRGVLKDKSEYKSITNEYLVPHSTAKHARLTGDSYMVGALARFNINYEKLHPLAKYAADELKMKPVCSNPYLNTAAQIVECFHFVEDSIHIIDRLLEKGTDKSEAVIVGLNENEVIKVKAGRGVGAVEVPRGLLYHCYEVDERGTILSADCVIPTGQNLANIELDMRQLASMVCDKTQEEATLLFEMMVRAYDPCISCSTHVLEVDFV
ncbi:Ni/Fe hydrogenase subunit alpha [Seleniivibrio woodruffii]|uniref:Coenzyme F420-reducing hydrogenase alpha subunit n=1 Tax=Seleniivibrio woodruffii TaxID=1078050 RepID=A0A4R1K5I1_9BACT|nr:nickel-dependent hydrogenase large subunit [Seleniivibrio woodruffii]TCK59432.1 coenzyme F420-reducing hydrogenase alpha subunit [Seleniivibrio woodruffii]TVZ35527.1 coenzyme F420-reducing hydrogenase alpha subunit [Seleniivibrio woodruffii]